MKSLLLEEYGKLAIADMPRPEPGEHEVLVRWRRAVSAGAMFTGMTALRDGAFRRW